MEQNGKYGSPRVSVIMGVYNGERFLCEALDSILNQTFENFEFLICNDCSTDGSAAILSEYEKKDGRIRLLYNEKNSGLAASLNRCIEIAKGEYLARMDCDDRALCNRFEEQIKWLDTHKEVDVVGTLVEYINDAGAVIGRPSVWQAKISSMTEVVRGCPVVHPSVMMRTEVIRNVGGYTSNSLTTRAEDYDLWCRVCEVGGKIANVNQVLFQYREDQSNLKLRKYKHRIQEFQLKWYWIRRTKQPLGELRYAVKPLLVGLLPSRLYKWLHFRKIKG